MFRPLLTIALVLAATLGRASAAEPLKVGVFAVDASPPVGSPMAYDPTKGVAHPLSCRGVVLIGAGQPIVLCAVDWIGIANDGQTEFRKALADGGRHRARAGRGPHAAPARCPGLRFLDRPAAGGAGDQPRLFDAVFARDVIARAAVAVRPR